MVSQTLQLIISVSGGGGATQQLNQINSAAQSANRSLHGMNDTLRFMRNALVGISFVRAFEGIASAVNMFQQMENKLRLVTNSTQEAKDAQVTLARAAIETRQSYESTATVFAGIARSTKALGLDYGQILKLTKEWNQSVVVSGVDQNQARNALKDFIEELNIGVIQGRQLRALLMQNPEFLRLMAEGMSKVGKASDPWFSAVRKATEGGKQLSGSALFEINKAHPGSITSQQAVQAALLGADEEAKKFNTTTTTIGQSFENLKTKAIFFFSTLTEKAGALDWLQNQLNWIGDHLDIVTELAAAFASLLVLNTVTGALRTFGGTLGSVFGFATQSILNMWAVLGRIVALLGFITGGFSLVGIAAVAVGALIIAAFWTPIQQAFSGLNTWAQKAGGWFNVLIDIIAIVGATVQTVFDGIRIGFDAVAGWVTTHFGPVLGAIRWVLEQVGSLISKVGQAGWDALPDSVKNTLGGAASSVSSDFMSHYKSNQGSLQSLAARAKAELASMSVGGAGPGLDLTKRPPGSGNEGVIDAQKAAATAQQLAAAQKELASLLGQFGGPADKYLADLANMHAIITKLTTATKTHAAAMSQQQVAAQFAAAGFKDYDTASGTSASFSNAMIRSVMGLKNTDIDLANAEKVAAQAIKQKAISVQEAEEYVRKATVANQLYKLSLYKGTPQEAQAGAMAGLITGQAGKQSDFDRAATYAETLAKTSGAASEYQIKLTVLNTALANGVINQGEFNKQLMDAQIALAKTGTDAASGFTAGLLEAQKTAQDVAAQISSTMTKLSTDITDSLVDAMEGKRIDIRKMATDMGNQFLHAFVNQNVTGPLMGLLGPNGPAGNMAATALGIPFGSLFGGGSGGSKPGSSPTTPLWVKDANNPLGSMTGLGAGTGGPVPGSVEGGGGGGLFGGGGFMGLGNLFGGGSNAGGYGSGGGNPLFAGAGGGTLSAVKSGGGMLDSIFGPTGLFGGNGALMGTQGLFGSQGFFANLFQGNISQALGATTDSTGMFSAAGAFGSQGMFGSAISGLGDILGFANGGEFLVGGAGGTDSQLVAFRATPNETVSIRRPGQGEQPLDRKGDVHLHLHGVTDADSFKRSSTQVQAGLLSASARQSRRSGKRM